MPLHPLTKLWGEESYRVGNLFLPVLHPAENLAD